MAKHLPKHSLQCMEAISSPLQPCALLFLCKAVSNIIHLMIMYGMLSRDQAKRFFPFSPPLGCT